MEVHHVIPEAHSSNILCLAYNPYQQRLFTGSEDTTIKVWDLEQGRCERTLVKHEGWVTDLLYCDRYNLLFSCSMDGTIAVWSPLFKVTHTERLNVPCSCLAWDKKRKQLIAGMKDCIYVYKLTKTRFDTSNDMLEILHTFKVPGFVRCMVCFDGRLVAGSFDRALTVYDTGNGRKITKIPKAHKSAVSVVAYDEDNNRFVTGGFDKKVKIWNLDGTIVFEIGGFTDIISGICYNPVTKTIWVSANSPSPQIFDPISGMNMTEYVPGVVPKFSGTTLQLINFIPFTGEIIGTTSNNKGIITWKHNPFTAISTLKVTDQVVETLAYSMKVLFLEVTVTACHRYGPQVFSAGSDSIIKRWEISETDNHVYGQEKYRGHVGPILTSQYYDELDLLVTAGADKLIRIWSYTPLPKNENGSFTVPHSKSPYLEERRDKLEKLGKNWLEKVTGLDYEYVLPGHTDNVTGVCCVKCDGHFLISVGWDMNILIWDLNRDNGHLKKTILEAHDDYITDVCYSPDLCQFATSSVDGKVFVWGFKTFQKVGEMVAHTAEVTNIAWNSTHKIWITSALDSTIRLWTDKAEQFKMVRTHGGVTALCIDSTHGYVVAGTVDNIIRVYDVRNDAIIQENAGHSDNITCILHAKELNQYVSSSWDGTIRIWAGPAKNRKLSFEAPGREEPEQVPEGEQLSSRRPLMSSDRFSMKAPEDKNAKLEDPKLGKNSKLRGPAMMKQIAEQNARYYKRTESSTSLNGEKSSLPPITPLKHSGSSSQLPKTQLMSLTSILS